MAHLHKNKSQLLASWNTKKWNWSY